MHPERHAGRRRARTQALARNFGDGTTGTPVLYTDAARYPGRRAMCLAVIDNTDALKVCTTVLTADSGSAEEAAIALAIVHASILPTYDSPITIVTDTQAACRAFAQGLLTAHTHRILSSVPPPTLRRPLATVILGQTPRVSGPGVLGDDVESSVFARAFVGVPKQARCRSAIYDET
ncbi:hypothetical protein HPB49_004797 [Dermacentor silvarum]|uniref:Uncharacterized protein n=1 Tax=Dermacentor silvarum TaxID=543639 RepID=A0ACB8DUU5_DERSI|nr:hypothetical protein HPB49_004797 [Dermacentor silvarum]